MQGNVLGQSGGGLKIDEIIKEYQVVSGGNVNVGDFVKYIEEIKEETINDLKVNTNLSIKNKCNIAILSVVQLSPTKIFIICKDFIDSGVYGIICTIDNEVIKLNSTTQLNIKAEDNFRISATLLEENKIFIVSSYTSSSYHYIYGTICTIEDDIVTQGENSRIVYDTYILHSLEVIQLSSNRVFVTFSYHISSSSDSYYMESIICTISGTTINKGTVTRLYHGYNTGEHLSTVCISSTKVFIAFTSELTNEYLYGMICIVSNESETITVKSPQTLSRGQWSGGYIKAILIDDNKIFIKHSSSTNYLLYGMICTVSESTNIIIKNSDTQLETSRNTGKYQNNVIKLPSNRLFITYNNENGKLNGMICTINSNAITINSIENLSKGENSGRNSVSILLSLNKISIVYYSTSSSSASDHILTAMVCTNGEINQGVKQLQNTTDEILGIAKTTGKENEIVQVYVRKTQ